MQGLTSMSIRLQLRLYFIAIIALITVCFTLFFQDIRVINVSYSQFNTRDMKIAELISRIWSNIYEFRGLQHHHKDTEDWKKMREVEKQLISKDKVIKNSFAELAIMLKGSTRNIKLNKTLMLWNGYSDRSNEFLKHSRKNDWDTASVMLIDQTQSLFENITTNLNQLDSENWQAVHTSSNKVYNLFSKVNFRLALIAAAIIALLVIILFNVESILCKLVKISVNLKSLSNGNKILNIDYTNRKDEIGLMASSLMEFYENILKNDEQHKAKNRIWELQEKKQQTIENSIIRFQEVAGEIINIVMKAVHNIKEKTNLVASRVDQVSDRNIDINEEAGVNAKNLKAVLEAMYHLARSLAEINHQVTDSSRILDITAGHVNNGDMIANKLLGASNKVGEITNLITSLTDQINLLALNATIEAARVGEAGKGFAVVAGEIKNLAQQAASSTEEVAKRISTIQEVSLDVSKVMKDIANKVKKLIETSGVVAASIEAQEATTKEAAMTVHQVTEGAINLSTAVNGVSETIISTSKQAYELKLSTEKAMQEVTELKSTVEHFLDEVRDEDAYANANT
jgi:methyl-accepting chemotaxis protein